MGIGHAGAIGLLPRRGPRILYSDTDMKNIDRMAQGGRRAARLVQRGFTLIELMVVLVIIGLLAALIVPNVLDRADDARVTAARTDVSNLMQALKLYKLDNQRYPSGEQGLQALVAKPSVGTIPPNWKPYLEKLPMDPWGHAYQYVNPGVKGQVDVFSFGADGQSGGEGRDADIGSWQ
jgi:general secretion pathway protein G